MQQVTSELRRLEIDVIRDETIDLLCHRHRLEREVAERIVRMARNVDHAHALAELMR